MRIFLISAALLSGVAMSAPAAAQYQQNDQRYGYNNNNRYSAGFERQLDQIEQRIDRLRDRRRISPSEARRLERQADQLDRLHDRYRRNGLSEAEMRDLQSRLQNLRAQVREDRRDRYRDRADDRDDRRDDRRDGWRDRRDDDDDDD